MKKILKKSIFLGCTIILMSLVFSCEEDFTDIGSNVISNTKFNVNATDIEITLNNSALERIPSDNITTQLDQFLLGVYKTADYESLRASVVSQIGITPGLVFESNPYGTDTIIVTKIDTAFLKIPYQVSLNTSEASYKLDSIFGDPTKPFNLNLYRSNTYINAFNPSDPSKANSYNSDDTFEKIGSELNAELNYKFIPSASDTAVVIKRRLFNDQIAQLDTFRILNGTTGIQMPFARIPLKEDLIKQLFLEKMESTEFSSQEEFNNYFRGLILEATGTDGSLIGLDLNTSLGAESTSIEVYYTQTALTTGNKVVDTITKNNSFPLSGFKVNLFDMDERTYPVNNEVKVQGTAGSEGIINFLTPAKVTELRSKNWLINDATITLYVNQSIDTTSIPTRLYLYKSYPNGSSTIDTQIKDAYSESFFGGIRGFLQRDENGKKDRYTFKITDYISDIVSGEINNFPNLKVKVFNITDTPLSPVDTILTKYSWSHKGVTLFNHLNSTRKPVLTISYSEPR